MAYLDEALITFAPTDKTMARVFTLNPTKRSMEIGRASRTESKGLIARSDNTWFDSPVMSRTHAEIQMSMGAEKNIFIRDLGSTHGTFIGSHRLEVEEQYPLKNGTVVSFGQRVTNGSATFYPKDFRVTYKWQEWRPRGAHMDPERWNKNLQFESQSSYSGDSDSEENSSREASLERLTPKSLVDEAEAPAPKKSNTGSTVADSNADVSDDEAEYLASEEEEYAMDPFEQELSDGLSSADDANEITCKAECQDSDHVKDEVKTDEVSPTKAESEERSWHPDWNSNSYSNPFSTKFSGVQAPEELYSTPPSRVHAPSFGPKALNATRQTKAESHELEPPTSMADSSSMQSNLERPSSPSDAALFKPATVTIARPEVSRISISHEESAKPVVTHMDNAYNYFEHTSHRQNPTPPPYPANMSNNPEILNMAQSYYQAPFQMQTYRESVESISQKNEDASFTTFGYGSYPQLSRPTAPAGYRWYPNGYTQECIPNEAAASTHAPAQPYWRSTYHSVTPPSSQTQVFPMQVTANEEAASLHERPYPKSTMLTISEIVNEGSSSLSAETIRGTKRKAEEMEEDASGCQGVDSLVNNGVAATPDIMLPDAQAREDMVLTDEQSQSSPAAKGEKLQSGSVAKVDDVGPAKKRLRTNGKSSMLRSTGTFLSSMLAGGISVFGALLVYGATAPESIQDRVRLEFS